MCAADDGLPCSEAFSIRAPCPAEPRGRRLPCWPWRPAPRLRSPPPARPCLASSRGIARAPPPPACSRATGDGLAHHQQQSGGQQQAVSSEASTALGPHQQSSGWPAAGSPAAPRQRRPRGPAAGPPQPHLRGDALPLEHQRDHRQPQLPGPAPGLRPASYRLSSSSPGIAGPRRQRLPFPQQVLPVEHQGLAFVVSLPRATASQRCPDLPACPC